MSETIEVDKDQWEALISLAMKVERGLERNCAVADMFACGCLPESRPRGIAGLGIREWTCTECGEHHDRDVNAARNILAAGHRRLAVGISRPHGEKMPNLIAPLQSSP